MREPGELVPMLLALGFLVVLGVVTVKSIWYTKA